MSTKVSSRWVEEEVKRALQPPLKAKAERKQRKARGAVKSAGSRRTNPDKSFKTHAPAADPYGAMVFVQTPSPLPDPGASPSLPQLGTPTNRELMSPSMMMPPLQHPSPYARHTHAANMAVVRALGDEFGGRLMFGSANPGFRVPNIPTEARLAVAEAVLDRGLDILPFAHFVDPLMDPSRNPRAVVHEWSDAQLGMMATVFQTATVLDTDLYSYVLQKWRDRYNLLLHPKAGTTEEERQGKFDEASKLLLRIRALEDKRLALRRTL